jgi:hypothetical protein
VFLKSALTTASRDVSTTEMERIVTLFRVIMLAANIRGPLEPRCIEGIRTGRVVSLMRNCGAFSALGGDLFLAVLHHHAHDLMLDLLLDILAFLALPSELDGFVAVTGLPLSMEGSMGTNLFYWQALAASWKHTEDVFKKTDDRWPEY